MNLAFHEAANIFPLLEDEELDTFADDIKANGLKDDIELLDGEIIDGRNRYRACLLRQVKPSFKTIKTDDPVGYVLSKNLHRRHLSETQRAMVGQRARAHYDAEAKERQKEQGRRNQQTQEVENLPPLEKAKARDQAGKAVGVSGKSIDYARTVLKSGCPELIAAADADKIAISTAARLAARPHDEQREVLKRTKGKPGARKNEVAETDPPEGKKPGVGVIRANEAINCLIRIPKNDPLRKRGFQIVTDWIKANK